ncbi:MAG: BREX system P-loop protein BrxC [Candidatus Helarchaeota archaeon]
MRLQEIFQKDIYRHIEGVIKADDETNIIQEVEEYVITREIQEKLDHFFSVYSQSIKASQPTSEIGVWISGFFGSGKSHLLKMLSYILENRELNGRRVGEIFLEKIDESDFELRANIETAISIPAKSILFNIDQKAEITSKTQPDAILSVFNKVLNELCGYSPQYAFVAELERHLDLQGIYQPFKEKYKELFGETWEKGREMVLLEADRFARTLAEVKGISEAEAKKVFERYEKQDKISIEDFALKVKEYIDRQPKNFRLIFCVDEMGQYISDNSKLMLNLQTISESLATICKGRAWIIVTSQEDMETLVGELKDRQEEDFSKIMARFATRINLSSANVDEVIQKRLLAKNPIGVEALVPIYDRERNNFKTIFHFGDGSRQYRTYQSEEHFINTYPFVPYQFDLFQASIRGLSRHNAFQGRHQSVGERSMLGVFQHVVQKIAEEGIGRLVSYDHLFDGIRSTLRSEVQTAIINAENNLENPLDVRVLKALFLVKYVREFIATPKNIATLLVDHLGIDLMELEKRVQESLNRLEDQTYVQQIGGVYEFLTDVEKDVENEIKATEVDIGMVRKTISEMIFYDILRDTKIRFEDNQREYGFARKVDYHLVSREDELTLHFITPLCEENINESILKAESMGRRELIIQLAYDPKLKKNLKLLNKTEKYIQQTQHSGLSDEVKNLLITKANQNRERRRALVERIEQLIADGTFYLNGNILTLNGGGARTKIVSAFQHLIRIAYPNLRMLKMQFREEHLKHQKTA